MYHSDWRVVVVVGVVLFSYSPLDFYPLFRWCVLDGWKCSTFFVD